MRQHGGELIGTSRRTSISDVAQEQKQTRGKAHVLEKFAIKNAAEASGRHIARTHGGRGDHWHDLGVRVSLLHGFRCQGETGRRQVHSAAGR